MSFKVALISGPRRSGKTTAVCAIIDQLQPLQPHYIRLASIDGSKKPPQPAPHADCKVSSASWVTYHQDRIFETLPDALARIHKRDRNATVLLEADTDPNLRHAYPYDRTLFVLAPPPSCDEIFRTGDEVRQVIKTALHDTTAFAGEVYGLNDCDSSKQVASEHRGEMTDSQISFLLGTPLGEDLNARVQLHPRYCNLLESDAVVINTGLGTSKHCTDDLIRRLESLVGKGCPRPGVQAQLFSCDLKNVDKECGCKLRKYFRTLFPC